MEKKTADYFAKLLRSIYDCEIPFEIIVSKKMPKTRCGCYIVNKRRIRIYYIDNWSIFELEDTAIHEYAHHIHYTEMKKEQKGERPHGPQFWRIYSALMAKAIIRGIYNDNYIDKIVR